MIKNAILCCFCDFHPFMIWRARRGVVCPLWFYGCLLELIEFLSCRWMTAHLFQMDLLLPQSTVSQGCRKCVHEIFTQKNACLLLRFFFVCFCCCRRHLSRTIDISHPLHLRVSVTVRATRALEKITVVFFLLCHEVAVPWIPSCGPPLPLHARNVVLKSEIGMIRKSSLPQTPLGGL